jgi:pimeloyl-ACP methyl ester carboxylesterase
MTLRLTGTTILALGLLLAAPTTGAAQGVAEPTGTATETRGFVDVGGYRLYVTCAGAGSPTVVLEAGFSGASPVWGAVQPGVTAFTRACAYDRANRGRSDRVPTPAGAGRLVGDLHAALARAQVLGPYVLAGHSFGGLLAGVFASRYPTEVAGLVLVDPAHHEYYLEAERYVGPAFVPADGVLQGVDLRRSGAEARDAGPLPDVPVLVLSRGRPDPRFTAEAERRWPDWQADLARRAPRGQQIVAQQSGHDIHRDQPQLVVDAIRTVVMAARQPASPTLPRAGGAGRLLGVGLGAGGVLLLASAAAFRRRRPGRSAPGRACSSFAPPTASLLQ